MREAGTRRVPVMTRADRTRFAFLTSTHVVDDLYQGAVPALLPFLAIERHYSYTGLTGITLAATFLASVVQPGFGTLSGGWLADHWQRVGVLRLGYGLPAALGTIAVFPAVSCALTFLLRDPRRSR